MRLPRDISGAELIKKLELFGYYPTRQTGSHVRITCSQPAQHHLTVPKHEALRLGTFSAIISDVAAHQQLTRDEVAERLFG